MFTPPSKWQPLPENCREFFQLEGCTFGDFRFVSVIQDMLEKDEIEVEFRTFSNYSEDPRNQYWWRVKPQGLPFDRLDVGDTLTIPYPAANKCRFRVREIRMFPYWEAPVYVLQLYSMMDGKWQWLNKAHDYEKTLKDIKAEGLRLEKKEPGQLELF